MQKTFKENGVTYTLNMEHVFTKHKIWLNDFVNIPHYFSVAFANGREYEKARPKLVEGMEGEVKITSVQNVCGELRVSLSAPTKEAALNWKRKVFDPMFREQAVDFYKKNHYMPYNFAQAFCHLKPGDTIRFYGRIPCWAADIDKINPLKEPQVWTVKEFDGHKVRLSRCAKEYEIDADSLFDPQVFKREYLDTTPDYTKEIDCATRNYFDPKYTRKSLDEMIQGARDNTEQKTERKEMRPTEQAR